MTNVILREKQTQIGFEHADESHCIVAGLVKDSSKGFLTAVDTIGKLCNLFGKVDVVILEYDSEDNTRQMWEEFSSLHKYRNLNVIVKSAPNENYPTTKEKIIKLRNNILDTIDTKIKNASKTYIFVTDLDIVGDINLVGLANTVGYLATTNYDAITVRGISFDGISFYDKCAFKNKYMDVPIGRGLYECESAFSGGVFYKYKSVKGKRYSLELDDNSILLYLCEHIPYNRNLKLAINTNSFFKIYPY